LAERARLSLRAVSDLERGRRQRPYRDTVRLLAEALTLEPGERAAFLAAARPPRDAASTPFLTPKEGDATASGSALPVGGFLGAAPAGPLVARASEWARLDALMAAVAGGSGRLALLVGEPGIGKTRLAQEAALQLQARGFLIVTGRCYESDVAVPWYPFLEALALLYTAAPVAIRNTAARRWPYLGRLLPDQLGGVAPASTESREGQTRVFRAVADFMRAVAAAAPVALLLDDLHWADSASLDLFAYLARQTRGHRVLLLGAYHDVQVGRQHSLERTLREMQREGLAERVPVRRLDQAGTAALLAAALGEVVSEEFAALLYRHTEGNPFFTQEVLRALVERGDVYRGKERWERWERRAVTEIIVPESVRSAIGERLSRLPATAQEVLREASVLGQLFDFDTLQALGDRGEEEVEAALEAAGDAGLVREAGRDTYAFSHALTQQALYEEAPARRKRRLHRAAGAALERLPARERERRAAEAAWHFLEADEGERALPYVLLAGQQAERVFAYAEAERHDRTALGVACEVGDRTREALALERLGGVLFTVARYGAALEALERAAHLYQAVGDVEGDGRVGAQLGLTHKNRGSYVEGLRAVEARVEPLATRGPSLALEAVHYAHARLLISVGRRTEALAAAEQEEAVARSLGDNRLLARALLQRGAVLTFMGRLREALLVLEEALAQGDALGALDIVQRSRQNLAVCHLMRGEFERAWSCNRRAIKAVERLGDPAAMVHVLMHRGWLTYVQGEWRTGRQIAERALAISQDIGTSDEAPYPLGVLGFLHLAQGEWEAAARYLEESVALATRIGDLQAIQIAQSFLAELDVLQGRPAAARARLAPLVAQVEAHDLNMWLVRPRLAWAYLDLGDVARSRTVIAQAITHAQAENARARLVDALWVRAMIETREECWAEAEQTLAEALAMARGMGYPYAEGRLLHAYGRLHVQKGEPERARARLGAALAIFQRLGARKDAEHAEQMITALI